eukprot:CAMPEP_0183779876 /NCGR_PEP_ID=MMETSP0739-20130205/54921_1 /TAXON_ID=385413 /ORGANISM="Thalassiosira miniscula, Strain CCMP1093" /LENGTH=37 /DNA_ID= /DNA_START= /DNA_END= /DNA_ORIENTATION=
MRPSSRGNRMSAILSELVPVTCQSLCDKWATSPKSRS